MPPKNPSVNLTKQGVMKSIFKPATHHERIVDTTRNFPTNEKFQPGTGIIFKRKPGPISNDIADNMIENIKRQSSEAHRAYGLKTKLKYGRKYSNKNIIRALLLTIILALVFVGAYYLISTNKKNKYANYTHNYVKEDQKKKRDGTSF